MLQHTYDPSNQLPSVFRRNEAGIVSQNERNILRQIWGDPASTRASVAARLDLTQQSIHRLINGLCDDGLLALGPLVPPPYKGKPSPQLLLNPRYGCTLGVALDTDAMGVTCMDFAGGHKSRRLVVDGLSVAQCLRAIEDAAESLLTEMRFNRSQIIALGFAISGFRVGVARFNPPLPLAEWAELELAPYLSQQLGLATWTENGANTASLCEAMFGIGRTYDNFAYISFNYGLGAGLIVEGELLRGGFGNAGEISGMFPPDEIQKRPALSSLLTMLQDDGVNVRTIEDLSRISPHHPTVVAWLDLVAPHFSRIINTLASTVDPQAVVLGGQIPPGIAQGLVERTQFFGHPRYGVVRQMPTLSVSTLGPETPAIGAACLPLKTLAF